MTHFLSIKVCTRPGKKGPRKVSQQTISIKWKRVCSYFPLDNIYTFFHTVYWNFKTNPCMLTTPSFKCIYCHCLANSNIYFANWSYVPEPVGVLCDESSCLRVQELKKQQGILKNIYFAY